MFSDQRIFSIMRLKCLNFFTNGAAQYPKVSVWRKLKLFVASDRQTNV